jgi:hypothetical protein
MRYFIKYRVFTVTPCQLPTSIKSSLRTNSYWLHITAYSVYLKTYLEAALSIHNLSMHTATVIQDSLKMATLISLCNKIMMICEIMVTQCTNRVLHSLITDGNKSDGRWICRQLSLFCQLSHFHENGYLVELL